MDILVAEMHIDFVSISYFRFTKHQLLKMFKNSFFKPSSKALDERRRKIPRFVFHDFRTGRSSTIAEYIYILSIKNEGGFCPLLNIYPGKKAIGDRVLFDTFTEIEPGVVIDLHVTAGCTNQKGIGSLDLYLRWHDTNKNKYISQFTLENAVFNISPPKLAKRGNFLKRIGRLLSRN